MGSSEQSDSEFLRRIAKYFQGQIEAAGFYEESVGRSLTPDIERLNEIADRLEGRCKTCRWWGDKPSPGVEKISRECLNHEKIGEGVSGRDVLSYCYEEDGCFWAGPEFRCIHHEAK